MNLEIKQNTFIIDNELKINSSLLRRDFLNINTGKKAEPHIKNPPYNSYSLECSYENYQLIFILYFKNELLSSIVFTIDSELYGKSWDDYSEEKEIARKTEIEKLLEKMKLTIPAEAYYDIKGGISAAIIRYNELEN
ncbi:hypothetical protein CLV96_3970 [Leptospira meyeri]|uniref:Uncharacterized protein n=1 Tax=Leptospira meyeri TaxID=29508 RepID=A0A4R8MNB4_LEPME|nr:hypothetical protein [Leptospira meyeri]EKJ87111.1 hypothetical protein LEP1GSC017_0441 [Leptospira meyeri serovar Hardjo str. Went 5]TDY66253.1 hypothetical protein CLV96_3970 [Leptospira meyeri]